MKSNSRLFFYSLLIIALVTITSVSCKKKTEAAPAPETGTVTDADNNTYKTIKIGNQWWMAENLRTTKYRNGWPINKTTDSDVDSVWAQEKIGTFCAYKNDIPINSSGTYGYLYNWYVITDTNNIAPKGWHIPSDDEWKILETYLGMSQADADNVKWRGADEGDKLKVPAPTDWSKGNGWGTNASGFTALAGSCRIFNGAWGDQGTSSTAFWWSSTVHEGDNQVWYRYLDYNFSGVFRYHASKNYGMSIRCVKD